MLILVGIVIVVVALGGIYFKIKYIGRQEIINEGRKQALEDAIEVKKRDIKHANDPMSDVVSELLKDARD